MTEAVRHSIKSAAIRDRELELWAAHCGNPSAANRENLFRFYLPLVRRLVARYLHLESKSSIEYDDLFQLACTGLLESIDRFKPELGVPFRYFANRRINGAILNGVAIHSEVSQQISTRRRLAQERIASLRRGENDPATLDDALSVLGEIAGGLALGLILEEVKGGADERLDPSPNAFETVAWNQMVKLVRDNVEQLPPRDRDIMIWHYIEGLRFEQIGDLFGITKGRVSQLHKAAIALLRKRLLKTGQFRLEG
jgi:RNA polymerase sigma factor FliA